MSTVNVTLAPGSILSLVKMIDPNGLVELIFTVIFALS